VIAKNILKIKEVFPALPNRKIIKIHNVVIEKLVNRNKKNLNYYQRSLKEASYSANN